jgi:transposase-like protein
MDQRVALVADWLRNEWTITELAARYAISRKTVYKWIDRYEEGAAEGLVERSRAPHTHGRAMRAEIRNAVLALTGTSTVGTQEVARDFAGAGAGRGLAGREFDRRPVAARGTEHAAASNALHGAADAALGRGQGAKRRLDRGFQRMVSDR